MKRESVPPLWKLWANPVLVKCWRARLRWQRVLTRAVIVLSITAFIFLIIYLSTTERGIVDRSIAAKATIVPILVVQGILLMFVGTGSVASGIAMEKDSGVLDFHRITPIPVTHKMVGYLLGLPAREYFLFALTLPFTAAGVIIGRVHPGKILHLYGVFFVAVLLYHMTGFTAGILSRKPRRARNIAQVTVIVLYLVLPRFADLGFTFFEFLTVKPTLYGIVMEELVEVESLAGRARLQEQIAYWKQVPFYGATLHPTVFTLMIQGFLLAALFIVVYRKWLQPSHHAFSKVQAMAFFTGLQFLLVGSLWPFIVSNRVYSTFFRELANSLAAVQKYKFMLVLYIFFFLSGLAALLFLLIVTPSRHIQVQGLRRRNKLGWKRIPRNFDAASSRWVAAYFVVLTGACFGLLVHLARGTERFFTVPPSGLAVAELSVLFAAFVLYIQAALEWWGGRGFALLAFLAWVVPIFVILVILAAWGRPVLCSYLALPSPIAQFFYGIRNLYMRELPLIEFDGLGRVRAHIPMLTHLSLAFCTALAVFFQVRLQQHWHVLEKRERAIYREPAAVSGAAPTGSLPG